MSEAADAQVTESRELEEHGPVEMDVEMAEDESRALRRYKVTVLTLGGHHGVCDFTKRRGLRTNCASSRSTSEFRGTVRSARESAYSGLMTTGGTQTGRSL